MKIEKFNYKNIKQNKKLFNLNLIYTMDIILTWEVVEISHRELVKSQNGNNYFAFFIKEKSDDKIKWIIEKIKCYYITQDVYKWNKLAQSINVGDLVYVIGKPSFDILNLTDKKTNQTKQCGAVNVFVNKLSILYSRDDLRDEILYEEKMKKVQSLQEETETNHHTEKKEETEELKTISTEKEQLEMKEVLWQIFWDKDVDEDDLPFR